MQKILIVDDAPPNIKLLVKILENPDYEILAATHGQTALEIVEFEKPDLILLDIVMPGMDGYEVCVKLKANAATKKIPIIFITALESEEDEAYGFELGAVDYISKPLKAPIVKARVKNHLELKRQRDILENLSAIDGLTGIPNRRRFDEVLEQEWYQAIRDHSPLSLIMIDIDCFKLFNDNYGHIAGDDCLKQIALKFATTLERKTDLVARYGGEEFACILPVTNTKGAIHIANELKKNISSLSIPHAYSTVTDYVTISQGIATMVPVPQSQFVLVELADKALYEAKMCGRNQVKIWGEND